MQQYLKIAINIIVSCFFMVLGISPAAQAEEIELDFSIPEADAIATPTPSTFTVSRPTSLPPLQEDRSQHAIALDFSAPNANSATAPLAARFSTETQPQNPQPKNPTLPPLPKSSLLLNSKPTLHQLTALRRAIIGQESAGNFWLVNPDSGALGYGQLMPANVAPWTKAALGKALTPAEFLANPDAQIKTINHKLNEYLQREIAYTGGQNEELAIRRVAATWYSGNPNLWNDPRPQYYNGRRYPSISSYTHSVWRRYLRAKS
ncbi:MAG TPA: hypothetical protein DDZ80_10470 [Cyanobacteria bacterium UBA8803]|nr:hypothetical protein [Cyanobacteria bacterium UBA9273]HBL58915.1 hypothetical protein [Cyanobacteria bacterium UBA8803]